MSWSYNIGKIHYVDISWINVCMTFNSYCTLGRSGTYGVLCSSLGTRVQWYQQITEYSEAGNDESPMETAELGQNTKDVVILLVFQLCEGLWCRRKRNGRGKRYCV